MPISDIDTLRKSRLVRRVISAKLDAAGSSHVLKVRIQLVNGWFMDCWEHQTEDLRRYSFHVFRGTKMIVRWDNSPHHPNVKSFPHHKHSRRGVVESEEMTVEKVLSEIEQMIR